MWLFFLLKVGFVTRAFPTALCIFLSVVLTPAFAGDKVDVTVKKAWVKLAPPGTKVNAAYMEFYNHSSGNIAVVTMNADCCNKVMAHQSRRVGGRVFMDHLDKLEIPPQSKLALEPGGLHLMLIGAQVPLKVNDEVNITFTFSNGNIMRITAPVIGSANE